MTGRFSLRTRLTIAISMITLVVTVPVVLVGTALLRADAREAAVDAEFDRWSDLSLVGIVGEAAIPAEGTEALPEEGIVAPQPVVEVVDLDTGEIAPPAGVVGEPAGEQALALDPTEAILLTEVEATQAARLLAALRANDVDLGEFVDDDGLVDVLLTSGEVVAIDPDDGVVALDAGDDAPMSVLLGSSITAIGGSLFVPTNVADLDGRDFEPATRIVGGLEIGVVADVTDRLDALADVARVLWAGAAALTLLAGATAWLLVGRALRPVATITGQVAAITAGNLGERVPETGRPDEIGMLATTMNAMLGRLEADDLRRRRFVADASHELRTPVAVLQNEAEVASRSPGATTVDALADVVSTETRRLGGLVEGLLAIARGDEAAAVGDGVIEVDVDEIVLVESLRTRRVTVDRRGVSAGRILAHPDDVSRVVTHLLDNAARHADQVVAVGLAVDGGEVVLRVDDDGPGIPVAERERVFERFVRLDEARSRDQGGAGLGLAVVRSTVERSRGTVEVSDAPTGGARFEVRWPALGGEAPSSR